MNIDKDMPIGSAKAINKSALCREIVTKLEIGDSTLIDCNNSVMSSTWRSILNAAIVKMGVKGREFTFKKWDAEHYRIWRTK